MKCEKAKLDVLRADAGELVAWQKPALERHLRACAECRHYRADLRQLAEAVRSEPQPEVDAFAMRLIMDEARGVSAQRGAPSLGRRLWSVFRTWEIPAEHPALAAAAVGLLLAGGVLFIRLHGSGDFIRTAWNDGVDQQIERLQDTLTSFSQDSDAARPGNNELENIASELLEVGG